MCLKLLLLTILTLTFSKCKAKDYCSYEYCNNSKQHTLCKYPLPKPASHCIGYERTISGENERQAILDKINGRRNKIASGEIRSLPPAASMMKMEWNQELAESAQRWADQCVKHSVPDIKDACRDLNGVPVEQNIATIHGDAPGLTPMALVDVWYMELLNVNTSILSRYEPSSMTHQPHYDYFTQLVWDSSYQVGCGGVKFKEVLNNHAELKYRTIYRLVCNFAPAGNRLNKTAYSSGLPCSRCSSGGVCDQEFKGLCNSNKITTEETVVTNAQDLLDPTSDDTDHELIDDDMLDDNDYIVENISTVVDSTASEDPSDLTTFNYFSHLYEFTKQKITLETSKDSCKELEVDNFIDLLKKKLSSDPMIKELLATTKTVGNDSLDNAFDHDSVAAFVNRIYSKFSPTTTKKISESEYVNSTLLVDLIEAVIFRSGDRISTRAETESFTQPMSVVKPIMVQAELGEVRQNEDFTGHYFFPEDSDIEDVSPETESYYDSSNIPISDVVLEIDQLKLSTATNDFLDDILESEAVTEITTTLNTHSAMNINLYKNGRNVMKKFLQSITEKARP